MNSFHIQYQAAGLHIGSPPLENATLNTDAPPVDPRISAFVTESELAPPEGSHIVDVMIKERCPSFVKHWSWPILRPAIYGALKYRLARRMADEIAALPTGQACFDKLEEALALDITVTLPEHAPRQGRLVMISNHPTGLADGAAVWGALRPIRRDIQIMANADACRINPAFADVIIPVEWVADKRTPAKTRETLRRAGAAFRDEQCLVVFPSGRLAHKVGGVLTDKDWYATAVTLARKNRAPVTPVHIRAANSRLYYALSRVSGELRDITLFHELLNKQGDRFHVTFGPPIPYQRLEGDPLEVTRALKRYVENVLPHDPKKAF